MAGIQRRVVAVALSSAALLLLTAPQSFAAQRFAAPAPMGTGDCSSPTNACPLQQAVEMAGAGDEVIVKSDAYNEGVDPLLFPPNNLNVHGEAAMPKPVINFGVIPGMTSQAVNVNGGSVSWLRIVSTQASLTHNVLFASGAAQIERVEVEGQSNACVITGGARLRDSFCMTTTGAGTAAVTGGGGTTTVKLRNVTAKATLVAGVQAFASGGNVTVDAKNVIADGAPDAQALTLGGGDTATLSLTNSNYATTMTSGPGTESVTTACSGTNQNAPPMFGANLFTQLPTSVTIDAGAADADTGTMDIDGEARSQGAAIDIGADEFAGTGPPPGGGCGGGGGGGTTPANPATPSSTAQPAATTCTPKKKKKKKKRSASAAKKKKKKKKGC